MTEPTPRRLDRDELIDLLGAWAADALDTDERAAVDDGLERHPDLAAQARALREAVADLADDGTADPGSTGAVLAAALAARPAGRDARLAADEVATTAEAYADQVATLAALLDTVPDDGWDRPVAAYPWTVRELVGHLVAIERYSASFLHQADATDLTDLADEADHLAMSEPVIAELAERPVGDVVAEWRRLAQANAAHVLALDDDALDRPMPLHGIPFRVTTAIVARAFELWTHADDIRRALGRPVEGPPPAVVHRMATESVSSLPAAVFTLDRLPGPGVARVVLTGPGGGAWTIGVGGADPAGAEPDLTLVTDVVDYCRVASSRIAPEELAMTVEGERSRALDLLRAASFVAM